jgi:hypothetical protein
LPSGIDQHNALSLPVRPGILNQRRSLMPPMAEKPALQVALISVLVQSVGVLAVTERGTQICPVVPMPLAG